MDSLLATLTAAEKEETLSIFPSVLSISIQKCAIFLYSCILTFSLFYGAEKQNFGPTTKDKGKRASRTDLA